MRPVTELLSEPDREWRKVDGASQSQIAELIRALPFEPPAEYLEFLRYSNGGGFSCSMSPLPSNFGKTRTTAGNIHTYFSSVATVGWNLSLSI